MKDRTYDDIKSDLDVQLVFLKIAQDELEAVSSKVRMLRLELDKYRIDTGTYYPMSELLNYKGKTIDSITLVLRDGEGNFSAKHIWNDEILKVDNCGRLHYSSFDNGVMSWDSELQKYKYMYYGTPTLYDFIGFMDIAVDEDSEDE